MFGNNQTSALITLKVKGDAAPEANETFTVTLNPQPANAVLDPQKTSASGVILNDDNSAPTDVALSPMTISELAANGTVVGTLSTADPDNGDAFTYSLVGTDERFEVVGNQLKVKNGFKLDFEQAASHQVTVRTTDKAGATLDKIFSIGVLDVASEVTAGSTDNDVFKGGALTDVFFGNLGNDTLYGGAGNDQLKGDAGNDQLFGGLGKDVMTGGAGNDAFVFDAKVDKKTWKVNLDKVMDYNVKDELDLPRQRCLHQARQEGGDRHALQDEQGLLRDRHGQGQERLRGLRRQEEDPLLRRRRQRQRRRLPDRRLRQEAENQDGGDRILRGLGNTSTPRGGAHPARLRGLDDASTPRGGPHARTPARSHPRDGRT